MYHHTSYTGSLLIHLLIVKISKVRLLPNPNVINMYTNILSDHV